jgi:MoaD family protein
MSNNLKEEKVPRVTIKYLNIYYSITGNMEEEITFGQGFTLEQLLSTISQNYGPKLRDSLFDKEKRLKPNVWIMVDHVVTNNLQLELKDGDMIMFSLQMSGG